MEQNQPALLVLAAGIGSRYGGLKQIDPIGPGGETLLEYSIFDARRAGFGRVVFVIRPEIEADFKAVFAPRLEGRLPVTYIHQEAPADLAPPPRAKPWGTGQAVLAAAGVIDRPFAVINADDFYGRRGYEVLKAHLTSGSADFAMVGYTLRNTLSPHGSVSRGVCRLADGDYLKSITELTQIEAQGRGAESRDAAGKIEPLSGDEPVSMNMWGFNPRIFELLRVLWAAFLETAARDPQAEFFLPTAVESMLQAGRAQVRVLRSPDAWFGITSRRDCAAVTQALRRLVAAGAYPARLWM